MADQRATALPPEVRRRVVAAASAVLGSMTPAEQPAAVRRIAQFAPARRAKVGGAALLDALEHEVGFRQRTASYVVEGSPDLADHVRAGDLPADADLVEAATLVYLLRPEAWEQLLERATSALASRTSTQGDAARALAVERLGEQLAALRAANRVEQGELRAKLDALRAENTRLRQRLGQAREETREALRTADAAQARTGEAEALSTALEASETEARRLRQRLTEAEAALEGNRRSSRESRTNETLRARVLVETLVQVAHGLRDELALPALPGRPADSVGDPQGAVAGPAIRGRDADDPSLLAELLEVPQAHLVVDGYNVTMTAYGELALEDQRSRLLGGLGALAARTRVEITCVFDGTRLDAPVPGTVPRGVRVRFSPAGTTADDLIRDLVAAEPVGRPLVVVTSDRAIIADVRRAGAWTAGSNSLVRLLAAR